jgi:hypothetical protein
MEKLEFKGDRSTTKIPSSIFEISSRETSAFIAEAFELFVMKVRVFFPYLEH